eukprot:11660340-Prorocentrum_lima.AAC.1
MTSSLVGSEMCIRDSHKTNSTQSRTSSTDWELDEASGRRTSMPPVAVSVSYTHLTLPTICSV